MGRKIEQKLETEVNRQKGTIILFAEGGFYRAYEHSAYDAIKNLHDFKVTCRFYKAANQRIACIGFPIASLAKFASGNMVEQHDDMAIISLSENAIMTTDEEFEAWKEALPTTDDAAGPVPSQKQKGDIFQKIINYPLESRTPLQCMIFLAEIKNELTGNVQKRELTNGII